MYLNPQILIGFQFVYGLGKYFDGFASAKFENPTQI